MAVLQLPAETRHIESAAFQNIGAYIIKIPAGCLSIGDEAFANNPKLVKIYIPASVTSIAFDAFADCAQLTICAPEDSKAISLAKALGISYELVSN